MPSLFTVIINPKTFIGFYGKKTILKFVCFQNEMKKSRQLWLQQITRNIHYIDLYIKENLLH